MNIFAFMDSVYRVQEEENAKLLLQSGYSGFGISLKDNKYGLYSSFLCSS